MEVALTPYGRYMLSKGALNPTFYAFYDDDVIYDEQYANANADSLPHVEKQNKIEGRIQEDTPKLKVIRSRTSVEDEIAAAAHGDLYQKAYNGELSPSDMLKVQPHRDQLYGLKYRLASADPYSSNYPSWDIEFLQAKMTGSAGREGSFTTFMQLTGTFSPPTDGTKLATETETREIQLELIPQIQARGKYQTYLQYNEDLDDTGIYLDDYSESSVIIEEDFLLLKVEEKNTEFLLKNFDVQLFEVDDTYKSHPQLGTPLRDKEILIPLAFDGTLESGPYVEDFFDVSFDESIPNTIICRYINDQSQGVFSDMLVDCDDNVGLEEDMDIDMYTGMVDDDPGAVC